MPSSECLRSYAPDPALYHPSEWPAWLDELDLSVDANHLRMGTRALNTQPWLLRDHLAESELALRRRLWAERPDDVFACLPGAAAAAAETAELVDRWMAVHGVAEPDHHLDAPPLARAGLMIQEDLCLMVRHREAWHLEGALLCFPSLWNLHDKLGRTATAIHAPVLHYEDELSDRVNHFFDRLTPGRIVWRRNVSLWPTTLLWMPTPTIDPSLWNLPSGVGDPRLLVRSERQTLRRLPDSGAILFTIRVQMASLAVLSLRPRRAADLATWLRSPGGESRRTQLGALLAPELHWLDRVAANGSP